MGGFSWNKLELTRFRLRSSCRSSASVLLGRGGGGVVSSSSGFSRWRSSLDESPSAASS